MEVMDRDSGMLAPVFSHHAKQPTALWDGGKVKHLHHDTFVSTRWLLVIQKSRIQKGKEDGDVDVEIVTHWQSCEVVRFACEARRSASASLLPLSWR